MILSVTICTTSDSSHLKKYQKVWLWGESVPKNLKDPQRLAMVTVTWVGLAPLHHVRNPRSCPLADRHIVGHASIPTTPIGSVLPTDCLRGRGFKLVPLSLRLDRIPRLARQAALSPTHQGSVDFAKIRSGQSNE